MDIPENALVVVADGEKCLLLTNAGDKKFPHLKVMRHLEIENPPTREQGTDKPGRYDDAGIGKSAVQDTDWHALEKERFAEDLSDLLRERALKDQFRSLIVVADPGTLGVLRQGYHKEVSERIIAEIDKDLTNHPLDKIEKVLAAS